MKTKRPGIEFQEFVAALERAITEREGVTVESSKRLVDKDTGRLREHDVVITRRDAHHTIKTAVECKDTGRKIGVEVVEAFWKKCERTGIHHRVLVSANGFTATARTKAAALDIQCMELKEGLAFEWMGIDFFVRFDRTFDPIDVKAFFINEKPKGAFGLFDASNTKMTPQHFGGILEEALRGQDDPEIQTGGTPIRARVNTVNWHAEDDSGEHFFVDHLFLETTMHVTRSVSPIKTHSYTGDGANYAVVSTDLSLGDRAGKLLFLKDEEGIRVAWAAVDTS